MRAHDSTTMPPETREEQKRGFLLPAGRGLENVRNTCSGTLHRHGLKLHDSCFFFFLSLNHSIGSMGTVRQVKQLHEWARSTPLLHWNN